MPEIYGFEKMRALYYPFSINRVPLDSYEKRLECSYGKRAYLIYHFNTQPIEFPLKKTVNMRSLLEKHIGPQNPVGMSFVISFKELFEYID